MEEDNEEKDKEWMAAYNLTENQVQGTVSTRIDHATLTTAYGENVSIVAIYLSWRVI